MNYVFDLDGTLFDTKQAVFEAYKAAGVIMPDDAWGKPWHQWLDDETIRQKKQKIYPEYVEKHAKALPLWDMFREMQDAKMNPIILTGAGSAAVWALMNRYPDLLIPTIRYELTIEDKISHMGMFDEGIYFDDSSEAVTIMKERLPKWQIVKV